MAVWTRELIDAVLDCDGSYYLPYQPHARYDQFRRAYPRAGELFELKSRLDPDYRFRNCLWEKYCRRNDEQPLLGDRPTGRSEFLSVYGDIRSREDFYRFLQTIYHLYPEHRFHALIIDACNRHDDDRGSTKKWPALAWHQAVPLGAALRPAGTREAEAGDGAADGPDPAFPCPLDRLSRNRLDGPLREGAQEGIEPLRSDLPEQRRRTTRRRR
ncbi:MAG: hypothetical protein U5K76_03035 [Woeseiaceae bacterium]|nr:hypothetical protein [Woeseiaceae bacterium]